MGQPDSKPFEGIEHVPVLVLLGEPGTGKSQWFRESQNKIVNNVHRGGDRSLWIDLGLYDSALDVVNAVFGGTDFTLWAHGEHRLHLFLDSFDECHFRVNVLPKRLLNELRKQPVERLCLRILCRTSEWPQSLEESLRRLWVERLPGRISSAEGEATKEVLTKEASSQLVQVFEMTPFRKEDVIQIIRGEGIEPESFLNEVRSRELGPFGSRPQPLAFLVKIYEATGRFPANQVDLYRQGCRELCREPSRDRSDARLTGDFETDDLFAVAGRIAAVTVFCNRHSILRYDFPPHEVSDAEICFRDLAHGFERVNGREVAVGQDIIRETLNTGLFSGRPGGRMGWAHQTYAEFLAAEYLCSAGLPVAQIMSLIQHPHWSEKKIPPQLSETAAWLSLMKEDFLDLLLETDPEILLLKRYPDSGPQRDIQKERLVGSLLKLLDEERLLDLRIYAMPGLEDLHHSGLGDQLRPYISNRQKNFVVRRVAIRMAAANSVREVQDAICEVALDADDDCLVREQAARALIKIADEGVKSRLRPLAFGEAGEDPNDELKGHALIALWPDHLTADELFDSLAPPKNPNSFATYAVDFLTGVLLDRMEPAHLPAALRWIRRLPRAERRSLAFEKTVDSIIWTAYEHLEYPAVMEQFARTALHRLRDHEGIAPADPSNPEQSVIFAEDLKRRRLVRRMLRLTLESNESARIEAHRLASVVHPRDVPWLLDLLQGEPEKKTKDIVALLISRFFTPEDAEQRETVLDFSAGCEDFREAMKRFLEPVYLDSPEAERMRQQFAWKQERERSQEVQSGDASCSQEKILNYLEQIESGKTHKFAALSWLMIEPERACSASGSLPTDLTKLRSWSAAEEDTKRRISQVAARYIADCDPEASSWVGTTQIYWSGWAGYIALVLLLRADPDSFLRISNNVWVKWVPAILACSTMDETAESRRLLTEAYGRFPNAFVSHVINEIDYDNRRSQHVFILDRLGECWDERLSQAIREKLGDSSLKPEIVESLLMALSKHDPETVVAFAKSKLEVPLPARGRGRIMGLVGAKVLMLNFPEIGWPIVWTAIAGARLFGRRLMSLLAPEAYYGLERPFDELAEDALRTLYVWISREFSIPDEEELDRVLRASRVHDIAERILRHLQDRGTIESVRALQTLCTSLPDQAERLRWGLEAAKARTLAETWTPWRPEEVLGVVQDHQKRLVQSADQLLQVVIESISRFQRSLHDELPAVRDLWDRQVKRLQGQGEGRESWIPVDERPLSDRIARHLREDLTERGIVIGREVQIRPGELTDIHVDALTQGSSPDRIDVLKVIIEVKGCWNEGLEVDMERQLLDRYMAENQCNYGLYLVGWFYCESWDKDDYRSKNPRKEIAVLPIEGAHEMFDAQAKVLTAKSGKVIRAVTLDGRLR